MPDMQILSEMIKDTALFPLQTNYGKLYVELCEPQEPDCKVKIFNLPSDAVIIKVDVFRSPDTVFNGKKGECKRADYAIISAEKRCIIYIEMKRTKGEKPQVVKQLLGAQCFIKYCREIGKGFWDNNDFLYNYKERFISIGRTGSINKGKTKFDRDDGLHDAPQKHMKITNPHYLEFNRLAGLSN